MRNSMRRIAFGGAILAAVMAASPASAWAQDAAHPPSGLTEGDPPPLPPVVSAEKRSRYVWVSTGAGAVIGVLLADIVTGGILMAPLGLPSAAAFLIAGAPEIAPPTYSIAQRLLAGVATIAAVAGGGYVGKSLAKPAPDFLRLEK